MISNGCYVAQRNNKAEEIGTKVINILTWQRPIQSSIIFLSIIGTIMLLQSYSFIQILSFTLMLTTAINLIYVYSVKYYYYYIHGNTLVSHPYT